MKKNITLLLFFILCFASYISCAQAPNWVWAKGAGGMSFENSFSAATDASGNVYITGGFSSPTISFGSFTLTNYGYAAIFLVKYSPSGNVLWAYSPSGQGDAYGQSVNIDASGNVYVVGYFNDSSLVFGSTTLITSGQMDIFLSKFDINGNVIWAKKAGGTATDECTSAALDASGNIYITGWFNSSTIVFGSKTLTSSFTQKTFIAKYNSSVMRFGQNRQVPVLTDIQNPLQSMLPVLILQATSIVIMPFLDQSP